MILNEDYFDKADITTDVFDTDEEDEYGTSKNWELQAQRPVSRILSMLCQFRTDAC